MANINKPMGLTPVGHLLGLNWTERARLYYIASGDTNAYAIGDPVATSSGAADANGVQACTLATGGTGNPVAGVIVGWGSAEGLLADPSNLNTTIIPATKTKAYYALVVDDPYVIFECQCSAGGTYTAADIGKNANLVAGANNGYVSGWQIDTSAVSAVTATIQLRLLGLARRADNAFGSAYPKLLVTINNHELKAGTVGK
jgi:hypothetical protein